jgi:hypothetical protein
MFYLQNLLISEYNIGAKVKNYENLKNNEETIGDGSSFKSRTDEYMYYVGKQLKELDDLKDYILKRLLNIGKEFNRVDVNYPIAKDDWASN